MALLPEQHETDPCDFIMPFGKYAGCKLGDIAEDDPLYIDWLVDIEITNSALRAAVDAVAEEYRIDIEEAVNERDYGE